MATPTKAESRLTREDVLGAFDHKTFDENATLNVLGSLGSHMLQGIPYRPIVDLQLALNVVAANFAFDAWRQAGISNRERAILAEKVHKKASELLEILTVSGDDLTSALRNELGSGGLCAAAALEGEPDGGTAVELATDGVRKIQRWAEKMQCREVGIAAANAGKPKRVPDIAFNKLLANLTSLYFDWSGRAPAISNDVSGSAGGPLIRFIQAALEQMERARLIEGRSNEAVAIAWRRLPGMDKLRFEKS